MTLITTLLFLLGSISIASALPVSPELETPGLGAVQVPFKIQSAIELLKKGEADKAIVEARAALRNEPHSSIAYEVIGSAAMLKRDWKEAERALTAAIRLNPG